MRQTLKQFRVFLESNPYTAGAAARISGRARAAIFLYRLSRSILAQWARDSLGRLGPASNPAPQAPGGAAPAPKP